MRRQVLIACVILAGSALLAVFAAYGPGRVLVDVRGWLGITLNKNGTSTDVYQAMSGFVPALAVLSLVGSVMGALRLRNCHHRRCLRFGHHVTPKGYRLCKVHVSVPESELDLHPIHEDHQ